MRSIRRTSLVSLLTLPALCLALDWETAPADSAQLTLRAPGLPFTPKLLRTSKEGWILYELANWENQEHGWPEAHLVLIRMSDIAPSTRHFIKTTKLQEQVAQWFDNEPLTLRHFRRMENDLGEVDTLRFNRLSVIECIFIEQGISTFSDSIDFDSGAELLGNIIIRGWYCAPAGLTNLHEVFSAFVAGIGLKGFAEPVGTDRVPLRMGARPVPALSGGRFPPGAFDGQWRGTMACSDCPECSGPIEKPVNIEVKNDLFEFAPDLSYVGHGGIGPQGNVGINWIPYEGHGNSARPRNFWFKGHYTGNALELEGERGPRTCRVSLKRLE